MFSNYSEASDERPTISTVVAQLKDALALEEARNVSISDISQKGANLGLSFNSMPSERRKSTLKWLSMSQS
uniref:Uncharacterized protein n=1 Tax=Oryza nivara TaxID=4536 RepID=A0A0E0II56_ORYNI